MHEGHRERLRARFLKEGLESFEPHVVLEFLLFYGKVRCDTNPVAHLLLDRFGSLAGVFNAPYDELLKVDGIGETSATLIKLVPELCQRYMLSIECDNPDIILNNSIKVRQYLMPHFVGRIVETLFLLCLDNQSRPIECVMVSEGSINATQVDMRRITEIVLRTRASGVILSHNHPRGSIKISKDDEEATKLIIQHLILFQFRKYLYKFCRKRINLINMDSRQK